MILLPTNLYQFAAKITTDPFKVVIEAFIHLLGKNLSSVFSHKDQMQVK
jgi:hypothetical protein